jgi:hypothetical protein
MDLDVSRSIERKADGQAELMLAVKAKIDFYRKKAVIS